MSVAPTRYPAVKSEFMEEALLALQYGENCDLPMLPEVAAQWQTLTNDVDSSIGDIVPLIKRDQSLTSHLLRIANSWRYNTGVTVSSFQQAAERVVETVLHQSTPLAAPVCLMQAATLNLAIHLAHQTLNSGVQELSEEAPHPMLEALNLYPEQFSKITQNRNQILEWVDSAI